MKNYKLAIVGATGYDEVFVKLLFIFSNLYHIIK